MENGLNRFYSSLGEFKKRLMTRNLVNQQANDDDDDDVDDEEKALNIQQLQRLLISLIFHCGIACAIFCGEKMVFRSHQSRPHNIRQNQHRRRAHSI